MNRAQRRAQAKLEKRKPNRSREQLNNMVMLEFETFDPVERMFEMIRNGSLLYSQRDGWVIMGNHGDLIKISYCLGWWIKQWKVLAERANVAYDDAALVKLHKCLEYHKPLTVAEVDSAYAVIAAERVMYRTIDQQLLMKVVKELQLEQTRLEETKALLKAA